MKASTARRAVDAILLRLTHRNGDYERLAKGLGEIFSKSGLAHQGSRGRDGLTVGLVDNTGRVGVYSNTEWLNC